MSNPIQPRWFSIRVTTDDYEKVIDFFKLYCTDYWCQLECGEETKKLHVQATVYCDKRSRPATLEKRLMKSFEGISFNVSPLSGDRAEHIKRYVTKCNTRVKGPWSSKRLYLGEDLACIENTPHDFQKQILEELKKEPNDRTIVYYFNKKGNVGKSKLVKYLCFHKLAKFIKVTTADRLAAAICSAGPQRAYIVDIPRSIDPNKSLKAVFEVLEGLKNGMIADNMYGKDNMLFMNAPHVYVFSNYPAPKEYASEDRWDIRTI